jgi:peptide chain release factor 1
VGKVTWLKLSLLCASCVLLTMRRLHRLSTIISSSSMRGFTVHIQSAGFKRPQPSCRRAAACQLCLTRGLLTPAVSGRLAAMRARFAELNEQMTQGTIPIDQLGKLGREMSELSTVLDKATELETLEASAAECAEVMASSSKGGDTEDQEMYEMALAEQQAAIEAIPALEDSITRALLPRDEADDKNVILEVRAGTGGDESSLFCFEMFEMYKKFAAAQGWTWELLHISKTDTGGCREAAAQVQGHGVFSQLKFESGVHRVQRVPVNDVRVHTSAMSVAVLPEAEELDVHIDPSDIKVDTYRASGAGGQHVNTTDSAVRITHLPTGLIVAIQDERSQHQNRSKAMLILKSRVYNAERERRRKAADALRQAAMGGGDRSERIRTYNFPQDRVTDHRISSTKHGVIKMMQGQQLLEEFVEELRRREQDDSIAMLQHTNSISSSSSS